MKLRLLTLIAATTSAALHAETVPLGKIGDLELKTDEIREAIAGLEAGQDAAWPRIRPRLAVCPCVADPTSGAEGGIGAKVGPGA
jgi:hypothetical protein